MELLKKEQYQEYIDFLQQSKTGHFLQSPMWAEIKNNWGHDILVVRNPEGKIVAGVLALNYKLPPFPYRILYCPRGPICDPENRETYLPLLIKDLYSLAKMRHCYTVKIDPAIQHSEEAYTKQIQSLGFRMVKEDNDLGNTQPRYVFLLDIKGKTKEEVFAAFSSKTRYNIRLSERKGVSVEIKGQEAVEDFAKIMAITGARDGFLTREASYFSRMLAALGEHARLYMAYYEGKPIAGTIAVCFGNKTWYLYGASANESRNVMPNYQLQWRMIQWAIENGCEIYDFRGVSGDVSEDSPMYGLYRFKKGFHGEFTEFIGEYEHIVSRFGYALASVGLKLRRKMKKKQLKKFTHSTH